LETSFSLPTLELLFAFKESFLVLERLLLEELILDVLRERLVASYEPN